MREGADVTIRQASLSDLESLMRWRMEVLHHVFSIPERDSMPGLYAENEEYYRSALADGSHIACFAESNAGIVGCGGICFFREMPSPDNPSGQCASLMNIYTSAASRGAGVGSKTVLLLIGKAKEKGITKIYLETSAGAKSLYEGLGFVPMENYLMLGGSVQ